MTKLITLFSVLLMSLTVFAQSPEMMSYQAVVRDGSNDLVTEAQVGMQISILQGTPSGTAVYIETQSPTSNANGLVSLEIGTGVTISGDFSSIDWANGPYFIKTETDPTGGSNYTISGTSQLMSVPYALYAKESGSTNLNLNQVLTENNSANNQQIKDLADPTDGQDAVTKAYVDALIAGLQSQIDNSGEENPNVGDYPEGTVHCDPNNITEVVDVTNPTTGKTWMDRNLGASQVATSPTDASAYGDLYQWGRAADGHQCRDSGTTTTLSSTDQPGHENHIVAPTNPKDWRSPRNDNLWQGVIGLNNPCPSGYRIPTKTEFDNEIQSWSSSNASGAFDSPLKLTLGGDRSNGGGFENINIQGRYWTSSKQYHQARFLFISNTGSDTYNTNRANGFSIRCIKD